MARQPVEISVAADTKAYQKGIKSGVIEPLEDVQDAMKDVAKASDRTGDDMVDAMENAQRATDELADEHKDLNDVIEKGSRKSFKKFSDSSDDATKKAADDSSEYKDEAKANFSEVASSFSGDMDSAVDLVQGTLGGLAGSIPGGVGLALGGLGAAAGLFYNQWKEKTEAAKQRVQEMYDDMLASGSVFLSKDYIQNEISKIVTGADGAVIAYKNVQRLADATGTSQADLLLAFGGDMETRGRLIDELADQVVDYQGAVERAADGQETAADRVSIASAEAIRKLKDQNTEAGKSVEAFQAQDAAVSKLNATQGRTYDDMLRNQGEAIDSLGSVKEAAEAIPTDIKSRVTVTAKVNVDQKALFTGIQGALNKKTFKVFAAAYSAPNRNGVKAP